MMKTKKILLGILLLLSFSVVTWAQIPARTITGFTAAAPIKDAPYSAESNSESLRTLGDGNRIIRKTKTVVYRDSDGRTRNENYFNPDSPEIYITDPVANVAYILNSKLKTARRVPLTSNRFFVTANSPATTITGTGVSTVVVAAPPIVAPATVSGIVAPAPITSVASATPMVSGSTFNIITTVNTARTLAGLPASSANGYSTKSESLGKRVIEGVETEGMRSVTTIAPGAIGNEKAIENMSETWYSKDLHVIVLSKRTDPVNGDYTTQLTNIKRENPDKSLFSVPADYKITGTEVTISKPE